MVRRLHRSTVPPYAKFSTGSRCNVVTAPRLPDRALCPTTLLRPTTSPRRSHSSHLINPGGRTSPEGRSSAWICSGWRPGVITCTQPEVPEAKIRGTQKGFQWVILGLERAQGVRKGVRRGPVGPPGPPELAALMWCRVADAGRCGGRAAEARSACTRAGGSVSFRASILARTKLVCSAAS